MRTGRYSIGELFGNRHIEQLVIPEIQRDYVWGPNQVNHLTSSILKNFRTWQKEKAAPTLKLIPSEHAVTAQYAPNELQELQGEFAAFHALRKHSTNIGFVYAYCDEDLPGQYFLIDGQQRLTTIYLSLLAVASRDLSLSERFRARYCLGSADWLEKKVIAPTKLDYRLRENTAEFLHRYVHHFLGDHEAAGELKNQSWYLGRFDGDITIRNLIGNFTVLRQRFEKVVPPIETSAIYEYLENLVECWYFDTNESAQGEELYLYLNARGEAIADNENLKASLLSKVGETEIKDVWGRKWEIWQDYFWQHRRVGLPDIVSNPNADRGFNSFLNCIEHLEKLRRVDAAALVSLEIIEQYFKVICWLEASKEGYKSRYSYADWIDRWFIEFWKSFNTTEVIDWSSTIKHSRVVLVWGSLLSCIGALEKSNGNWISLDVGIIFRVIRVFFLRFYNGSRAVASLPQTALALLEADTDLLSKVGDVTAEERSKWAYLSAKTELERRSIEEVIWKIEDHPLNLNGSELGAVNLTHLVELGGEGLPTLLELQTIRDLFYELFPPFEPAYGIRSRMMAQILLYYGAFWNRINPRYYQNFDFGDWRRTIRGQGSEEKQRAGAACFRQFFFDFLDAGDQLEAFLEAKKGRESVDPESEKDLRRALIWYSEKLGIRMFDKGMHVAVNPGEGRDLHFINVSAISNTRGSFRGRGNVKMSELIQRHAAHSVARESQDPGTVS